MVLGVWIAELSGPLISEQIPFRVLREESDYSNILNQIPIILFHI